MPDKKGKPLAVPVDKSQPGRLRSRSWLTS